MGQSMTDQDYLSDLLSSQKQVTGLYNTSANECAHSDIKEQFMSLLKEEHDLQQELFTMMQDRGWYPTEPADQNKITQAKNKYASTF